VRYLSKFDPKVAAQMNFQRIVTVTVYQGSQLIGEFITTVFQSPLKYDIARAKHLRWEVK